MVAVLFVPLFSRGSMPSPRVRTFRYYTASTVHGQFIPFSAETTVDGDRRTVYMDMHLIEDPRAMFDFFGGAVPQPFLQVRCIGWVEFNFLGSMFYGFYGIDTLVVRGVNVEVLMFVHWEVSDEEIAGSEPIYDDDDEIVGWAYLRRIHMYEYKNFFVPYLGITPRDLNAMSTVAGFRINSQDHTTSPHVSLLRRDGWYALTTSTDEGGNRRTMEPFLFRSGEVLFNSESANDHQLFVDNPPVKLANYRIRRDILYMTGGDATVPYLSFLISPIILFSDGTADLFNGMGLATGFFRRV
jgi:hypothetical protein